MTRKTHDKARGAFYTVSLVSVLGSALLAACASFLPKPAAQPTLFVLEDTASVTESIARPGASAPTLIVDATHAAAGFDTQHMVYVRHPHELEYFALNQWASAPAQMLAPMIVRAIERTGAFQAVLSAPSAVSGEFQLDTELVRLQQEFAESPSRVRLTLRAVLMASETNRVIRSRDFDVSIPTASDDPYGGVVAANLAARQVLVELAVFCTESATQGTAIH